MYVKGLVTAVGIVFAGIGVWCLVDPVSFADFAQFGFHEHFLHDVGAFQFGLGVTMLFAVMWPDALLVALGGFFVANAVHTYNHFTDLDLGGNAAQAWALAATGVALGAGFWLRLRELGFVFGDPGSTTDPRLKPLLQQKTVRLNTFRKDGTPGGTPVSVVIDGDHLYVRSFAKALKTRRIARDQRVEIAPSDARGNASGVPMSGKARLLTGAENLEAARLLRRKYPFLHGLIVPTAHRLGRSKTGHTVHFEITPA